MNTIGLYPLDARRQLFKCLLISLGVHLSLLTVFYFHPIALHNPLSSLFGISSAIPELIGYEENEDLKHKNELLEEVFQQIIVLSPHLQQPYDLTELPKGIALAPHAEAVRATLSPPVEEAIHIPTESSFHHTQEHLSYQEAPETAPTLFSLTPEAMPISSQLHIDFTPAVNDISLFAIPLESFEIYNDLIALSENGLIATYEPQKPLALFPYAGKKAEVITLKTDQKMHSGIIRTNDLIQEEEAFRPSLFIPMMQEGLLGVRNVAFSHPGIALDEYQFPESASATEWNDDFDVEVVFLPNPEGDGYIFSLAMSPGSALGDYSLKQNYYFIIDRSNSIQKHRFAVFKRAVLKALTSMQKGDTFNIFVVDKKIARFHAANQTATLKNIRSAEEFLDKQEAGGLFAAGEIYSSLEKILPSVPDNDEMHTAILLTDGKTGFNDVRKQKVLTHWIEQNNTKLSLYAGAVGRDNDLVTLDLLCSISGGKMIYSDTHASFPRKLAKLILDLNDPIAKGLLMTALPHHPESTIELCNASSHLPSLFSHKPYVIYGKIDEPCSFDLVIQGKHRDQWIAIKKTISFIDGKKGDQTLENQWNAQQANLCYAKFLKEGKRSHLKEAKSILKKSRTEIAFE